MRDQWSVAILLTAVAVVTIGCIFAPLISSVDESDVVRVHGSEGWQSTGIRIQAGDRLTITYLAGEWSPWPGGTYDAAGSGGDPLCRCNVMEAVSHAALIGRIGDADPFVVGRTFDHVIGESGSLLLGMNDADLHDNSGEIEVLVELRR